MKQVDKKHYKFRNYCYPDRWASYWYQLSEIFDTHPDSVLEIGAGDYVVRNYIVHNTDISYKTLDIAADLKPDIVGDITSIPTPDESFDTVVAFEVLEHIPFDTVPKALAELARVSKKHVLISVPHFGPMIKFQFKIPFLKELRCAYKIPFLKKHVFNGQHYWEIGKKDFSLRTVRAVLGEEFEIKNTYIPFDNSYHRFFILEKKNSQ